MSDYMKCACQDIKFKATDAISRMFNTHPYDEEWWYIDLRDCMDKRAQNIVDLSDAYFE